MLWLSFLYQILTVTEAQLGRSLPSNHIIPNSIPGSADHLFDVLHKELWLVQLVRSLPSNHKVPGSISGTNYKAGHLEL